MNMFPESNSLAARSDARHASKRSLRGLDGTNFFLADVQTGVGPFLAIYLISLPGLGWNQESTGWALTVGSLAGIIAQTPAGALVDRLRAKRTLISIGVLCLAASSLIIALLPRFWPVMFAQVSIGSTSSVFIPAVAAISLGLVGRHAFDRRQGRNQSFNSAGNVVAAVAMGLLGFYAGGRSIFFFVMAMAAPTLLCLRWIDPREIDHDMARGGAPADAGTKTVGGVRQLLTDRRVRIFLACAVMFHFANAAMLPLLGEMLGANRGRASMLFMTACVVTTQLVVTALAGPVGQLASNWGRKRLLLVGFAVLPVRGVLYTLTHRASALVAIQLLDGLGAVVFGVVSVLVIADLTRGTGRFNLAQGAIATAVGIGASLSQVIAGGIAHRAGYSPAFLFLSAVAAVGLLLFWLAMPETKDPDRSNSSTTPSLILPNRSCPTALTHSLDKARQSPG
jgi:predicted MFS family arabinose efflux permease